MVRDHDFRIGDEPLRVVVETLQATPVANSAAKVAMAIGNLLRNAIQHTLAGEINVRHPVLYGFPDAPAFVRV